MLYGDPVITSRRALLAGLGTMMATASLAQAQSRRKVARIGWIAGSAGATAAYLAPFRDGLREQGWVEGKNLFLHVRDGAREDAQRLTAELMKTGVDVLVTQGPMVFGARGAAGATPIVFGFSGDPVEAKLVTSLARPGGTLTGMTFLGIELVGKRVEILKEAVPGVVRLAVVANPNHPGEKVELTASESVARRLGLTIQYLPVATVRDFDAAFDAITRERADAIMAFPDGLIMNQAKAIADFSMRRRIPAMSGWDEFAQDGNVMTYGPHLRESWRHIGHYVDKILKGAKAADLPVELPTTFQLVINTRAARAIGLTIPPAVLLRADRVIE
jgi:putative tryptophan/tyrosine transport system substrate-binding protein